MPWYSPPTRRELALLLFSLTTFVLFYNLESSFTTSSQRRKEGLKNSPDEYWDDLIYGSSGWALHEAKVAENAQKNALNDANDALQFDPRIFGSVGVNDGIQDWGDQIPRTTVLKHIPGYTIMDNVFVLNGTVFVVTDDPSFPSLGAIASSGADSKAVPRLSDWQILSTTQAKETLGSFGGLIHGVTWLVTDASPSNNYTLFALWRTYTALDTALSPDELTLPPPRRILYPHVRALLGKKPPANAPIPPRERTPSGFHPFTVKAAFPTLSLLFSEDWADYALLHVPFVLRRVVVADEGAARRGRANGGDDDDDVPAWAVPLIRLEASKAWWEPIRRGVARFVGVPDAEAGSRQAWLGGAGSAKTVVTYLTRQDAVGGPRFKGADHEALVQALQALGGKYEVHVVATEGAWMERMRAVARSTVVIGVYGAHMADCVYVPPSERATVMEVFPPGVFVRDLQVSVGAVGVRYVAWREGQQYGVESLPPVSSPPSDEGTIEVPIDVNAIIQAIRRIA